MKNWMTLLFLIPALLKAEIIETTQIKDAFAHVDQDTLVLIDMDDTLVQSALSVGSGAWRNYVRKQLGQINVDLSQPFNDHDAWTYAAAKIVPVKAVEEEIVPWIAKQQELGTPVFCFTARGRNMWYATPFDQIDQLTISQQRMVGVDFSKTKVPAELEKTNPLYFYQGTFYAKPFKKGEFLAKIFEETGYRPKKVVFIEDHEEAVKSVDAKLTEAQIPHVCIWYKKVEAGSANFKPLVATLQLNFMYDNAFAPSDADALVEADKVGHNYADEIFRRFCTKQSILKFRMSNWFGERQIVQQRAAAQQKKD
jgi:hypothetical protein